LESLALGVSGNVSLRRAPLVADQLLTAPGDLDELIDRARPDITGKSNASRRADESAPLTPRRERAGAAADPPAETPKSSNPITVTLLSTIGPYVSHSDL
jgi:hypothetical protein